MLSERGHNAGISARSSFLSAGIPTVVTIAAGWVSGMQKGFHLFAQVSSSNTVCMFQSAHIHADGQLLRRARHADGPADVWWQAADTSCLAGPLQHHQHHRPHTCL